MKKNDDVTISQPEASEYNETKTVADEFDFGRRCNIRWSCMFSHKIILLIRLQSDDDCFICQS
jgi:hypothetical protein